jgi:hypothetical protein
LDEKRKPYSTSEDLSNLAPGTYIVSVSDAKIAVLKQHFTMNLLFMDVSLISKTDLLCSGNHLEQSLYVVGGTAPYNYAWQDQMVL